MKRISTSELMENYLDTLSKCGTYLLRENDEIIEYNIFEDFDIGAHTFLHDINLDKLLSEGQITGEIVEKSRLLRHQMIKLQENNLWDIENFKNDEEWKTLLELADEINRTLRESNQKG